MTATELQEHYERELLAAYEKTAEKAPLKWQLAAMLAAGTLLEPAERDDRGDRNTWIWSDWHLGDPFSLQTFHRPFKDVDELHGAVFDAWRRAVGRDDTMICLGDAPAALLPPAARAAVKNAPGQKVLVVGNHDVQRSGELNMEGFHEVHSTPYCPGDPGTAADPHSAEDDTEGVRERARTSSQRGDAA